MKKMRIANAVLIAAFVALYLVNWANGVDKRGPIEALYWLTIKLLPLFLAWRAFSPRATRGSISTALVVNLIAACFSTFSTAMVFMATKGAATVSFLLLAGGSLAAYLLNAGALWKRAAEVPAEDAAAVVPVENATGNYLLRHWRGDLSLGVSYWVNGVLLAGLVSALLIMAIEAAVVASQSLRAVAIAALIGIVVTIAVVIWSLVGTWRSASKHVARGGKSAWAITAKVIVVISALASLGRLSSGLIAQAEDFARIAVGSDPLGKVVVQVSKDGRAVIVSGRFGEGSATEVEKTLDGASGATILVLNSTGGRSFEALKLAKVVRKKNLDTFVQGECLSACTHVFLAGKVRAVRPSARLGFHQPTFAGSDPQMQRTLANDDLAEYRTAGLPDWFVQKIGKTPNKDMWYPTRDELMDGHVVTRIVQ